MLFCSGLLIFCFPNPFQTSIQLCHRIDLVLMITMVLQLHTYSGSQDMELAGFLFTHSTGAMPTIQSTYYISLERSLRLEYSAVKILGIGPVAMEIFRN